MLTATYTEYAIPHLSIASVGLLLCVLMIYLLNVTVYKVFICTYVYPIWTGNVINIQTGQWTGRMSGLGAGIDSFYEYLLKVHNVMCVMHLHSGTSITCLLYLAGCFHTTCARSGVRNSS